ncbi:FliA/WhiG family RNA polymerase sigma factor [bacterium]|nr:FliA/WhiG family RNA polymerase sigma factor [bacterium]
MKPEEKWLWRKFKLENSKEALERLFERYMYLVKSSVDRMYKKFSNSVDKEDLRSVAMIGLLEAMRNFDPEFGTEFSTFAYPRINGAMIDELRRLDILPRGVRTLGKKIHEIQDVQDEDMTPNDIAYRLKISTRDYERILFSYRAGILMRLTEPVSGDEGLSLGDIIPAEGADQSKILDKKEQMRLLRKAIEHLPAKERLVVSLYYFEEMALKNIGQILSVSESRISQIHSKAIRDLREILKRFYC